MPGNMLTSWLYVQTLSFHGDHSLNHDEVQRIHMKTYFISIFRSLLPFVEMTHFDNRVYSISNYDPPFHPHGAYDLWPSCNDL